MELYADLFVVINMLCDLAILLLCGRLMGRKIKKRRLFLSCLLGGGYAMLWLLLYPMNLLLFFLSVLCSLFMVLTAFGIQKLSSFLRTLFYFYLVSLLMGGVVSSAYALLSATSLPAFGALGILLVLILFGGLFCLTGGRLYKTQNQRQNLRLTFHTGEEIFTLPGLYDSGNLMIDPATLYPVALIDPAFFDIPPPCDRTLLMKTPTGELPLPAFLPKEAFINGKECQICIGLCAPPDGSFGGFSLLLPSSIGELI